VKSEKKTARRLRLAALVGAAAMTAALVLAGGAWSGEPAAPAAGAKAPAAAAESAPPAPGQNAAPRPAEGKPKVVGPPDITFVDDEPEAPGQKAAQGGQAGQPGQAGQAAKPAEKPASNPFGTAGGFARQDAVPGYIELSSGLKVPGHIFTTRATRLKIYNLDREVYEYVPVPALRSIDTQIEWERMDKEWRFKEAGNPEKVYSGREYPVRKVCYVLTLLNDHKIRGHILGQPLYAAHNDKADRFLLHDRDKGAMGQTLADIPYIKHVELGPEAYNQAVDELKAKAEAAAKKAAAGGRRENGAGGEEELRHPA
jgi:hypothetical protein